jgi:hypothetical protein
LQQQVTARAQENQLGKQKQSLFTLFARAKGRQEVVDKLAD